MTNEEAIAIIRNEYLCVNKDCDIERSCGTCDLAMPSKEPILEAYRIAIKSLEAWEKIKDNLSQQIHHNLDVKENFEIGSTSRIECNTTASVLAGVIYLIDKHLSEVSE